MKHLMTLIALVVAVTAGAQGTTIHEYPWNPDSNNDNLIGVDDLLDFLPVFGDEFGNPPEPCTYDGTPLEEFAIGVADGSIVLDSMFIEYELEDVSTYYLLGCPDPVTDTLIVAQSFMLENFTIGSNVWYGIGSNGNGYIEVYFQYELTSGTYNWYFYANSLVQFVSDGFFGGSSASTPFVPLPFPEDWYLDEEGIHFESVWEANDWAYYANYLHILPYWHYAE